MAAAVKTPAAAPAPDAPRKSFIDRLRDKRGGKPLTVPQVEDEMQALDSALERQRQRLQSIEAELVDADGASTEQLHAEHQRLAMGIQTDERRRQQLLAERAGAQERAAVAEHVEMCDDYSRMVAALEMLESDDGELVQAYRLFTALSQQSDELRYRLQRQQLLIGDHRTAVSQGNPRIREAVQAAENSIADTFNCIWAVHWKGPRK